MMIEDGRIDRCANCAFCGAAGVKDGVGPLCHFPMKQGQMPVRVDADGWCNNHAANGQGEEDGTGDVHP